MQSFVTHSGKMQYFVKLLYSLTFVPVASVQEAYDTVVLPYLDKQEHEEGFDVHAPELQDLLTYFEKTWLGNMNRRTDIMRQPMFSITLWNKYDDVLKDQELTNNRCEGFNSGWSRGLTNNPTLYHVLEGFIQQDSWAEKTLREDNMAMGGNAQGVNKNRHLKAVQTRLDLKALCLSWGKMSIKEYMDSLIRFFIHE